MPIAISVPAKALARKKWPWLNHVLAAWLMVMILLYLGLLSLAAVGEISCRREQLPILKLEDGVSNLVTEQKYLRCRWRGVLDISFPQLKVPAWASTHTGS
jgi:hypothetical protein